MFFDVRIPYLAYGCINMRGCIAYIHDLHVTFDHMTLTFDLNVKGISSLTWIIFGMWVYHHEKMCHLHSWSLYNLDLDLKVKLIGVFFNMDLWSGYIFIVQTSVTPVKLKICGWRGVSFVSFTHSISSLQFFRIWNRATWHAHHEIDILCS